MSIKHIVSVFALLGMIIPVAFLVFGRPLAPNWIIYLWPSSIFLLGTSGHEESFQSKIIIAIAIGVNVVVYISISWIVGKLVMAMSKP